MLPRVLTKDPFLPRFLLKDLLLLHLLVHCFPRFHLQASGAVDADELLLLAVSRSFNVRIAGFGTTASVSCQPIPTSI
jgi:hypothetical protein